MSLSEKCKAFIKKRFPNLFYSSYVKDYLFTSNVRSSIYLSIVISVLEICMLIMVVLGIILKDGEQTFLWILHHTISYIILLTTSVFMLLYSIAYLKGKIKNQKIGIFLRLFFTVIAILFGLYISFTSYDKSGQAFAFITMETFCLCLLVWHPINHVIILTLSFAAYLFLQSRLGPITFSIQVNIFTMWVALLMTGLNIHHQRRVEAQKDENLEKLTLYLKDKSLKDELTKLPNLDCFQRNALKIISDESNDISKLRFVYIDIENFKNYNEKHGFRAGNNFLRKVAKNIEELFAGEPVARFSDDHFILLANSEGLEEKVLKLKELILQEEANVSLGLKCGIYMPQDRLTDPSVALDRARYACSSIKKHFSHDIAEYNREMNREFKIKQYIINNIDTALKEGYIEVYYQPVVWAADRRLCGAEALARWNDPTHGFLSPGTFIPILEKNGFIQDIDHYMITHVARAQKAWLDAGYECVPASVNVSRAHFIEDDLAEQIRDAVDAEGCPRNLLEIELTESAFFDDKKALIDTILKLKEYGFMVSMDDFGSGYSSLNSLKDMPLDILKLDAEFFRGDINGGRGEIVISKAISLAKSLNMLTVAEGVEFKEQVDFLAEKGCDMIQGYFFAKPMLGEEYADKMNRKEGFEDSKEEKAKVEETEEEKPEEQAILAEN